MKKSDMIKHLKAELNAFPVPDVLEQARQKTPILIKNNTPVSKHSFSLRFITAFMAVILIAFTVYSAIVPFLDSNNGYTTLSIDINPSVELTLNEKEEIVEVLAVNNDALTLINELNLIGDSIDNAIEKLLNKAIEQGFLTNENSNAILFSVKNKKSERVTTLKQQIENKMNVYLSNRNIPNTILFEEYHEELKEEYNNIKEQFEDKVNITPAKYQYIKRILARFPVLVGHEEYLAKMSILELHSLLTETANSATVQDLIQQVLQNIGQNGNGNGANK